MGNLVVPDAVKKKRISLWSYSVLAFFILATAVINRYHQDAFLPLVFGFFFGYIIQRSRFCFTAAFRDVFLIRNTSLTRAMIVLLALTTAGFILVHLFLVPNLETAGKVYPAGLHTVFGGILFGFGMVIAGSCVSGCLVRSGEGYVSQWFVLAGIIMGSALGAWHLGWWYNIYIKKVSAVYLPGLLGWPAAVTLQFSVLALLYILALKYERGSRFQWSFNLPPIFYHKTPGWVRNALTTRKKTWSYSTGAIMLAVTGSLMFALWGYPWSITGGITHLSGWLSCKVGFSPASWEYFRQPVFMERCTPGFFLNHPILYLALAMVSGSLFSSLRHREFRLRKPRAAKYIFSGLAGGVLMGYSSRIAFGCNIGALVGGIASFSLHGWVFAIGLLAGAAVGGRFLMRYLL